MQRSTPVNRRDLGTFDGSAGDGFQRGVCKVDLAVSGPATDPETGEDSIDLELTARYPGRPDQTVHVTLPAFAAEQLAETLRQSLPND